MGVVQDGLVLWLDANAQKQLMKNGQDKTIWKDISGNGNDGELINFDFDDKSGWTNNGLKFDGIDNYLQTSNLGVLEDLSIELSIYSPEISGQLMWTKGNDTVIVYSDGRSYIKSDTGRKVVSPSFSLNNKITNIVIIYNIDKQNAYYYQDSTLIHSETLPLNSRSFDFGELNIFSNYNGGQNKKGYVHFLRIYNRALTEEEIKQNYEASHFLLEPKTFTSNDYYNYYDLNRVELNTLATKDLAEILRKDIDLENIDFDRNMKAFPFADILNKVERNIDKLGNELYKPKSYINPKLDWAPGMPFSYEDANRLERNLQLLYNYAKGNIDSIKYAGEGFVGKGVIF